MHLPLPLGRKFYQLTVSHFYKDLKGNDQCNVISKKCLTSETHEDVEYFNNISPALPPRRVTDVEERIENQWLKHIANDS